MKTNYISLIILSISIFFSCSSKKEILYFQDIENNQNLSTNYKEYLIKPGDILKIKLMLDRVDDQIIEYDNFNRSMTRESQIIDGYLVNNDGFINFPQVGYVKLEGLTIEAAEKVIKQNLLEKEILTRTNLSVKVLNWSFTVIGEVKNPGRYYFDEPELNIIEAIGMAGDLTINGKRKGVKLIRLDDKKYITHVIDLTNSDFINQEIFQIFPGDIIIVNPNYNKVKNAGIIGNSGTLISLLSFLLSSLIVINN